ncbi:nucleotidyltransferase domain-containing protein [Patescibacteria group bacterium]|nr:nucleotidyltransferase domain-containing protein [Patescibacteria group bacterium]
MLNFLKNGGGEILKLFFKDQDKEYYFREIAKKINRKPSYCQKYLDNLVEENILLDTRRGNMRFFRLNKKYPLYEEIKSIVSKTIGLENELKELIDKLDNVECAFVFGSIAKKTENSNSDVDLMLIGNINQDALTTIISPLEGKIAREINYHIYSNQEIVKKIEEHDGFISNIFSSPIIKLKGNPYDFTRTSNINK